MSSASPGAVVKVPACVYHEQIVITNPLVLDDQGKAEIRSSDRGWNRVGGRWAHDGAPHLPTPYGTCRSGTQRWQWPEQVFYDGKPLLQAANAPVSGQF